MPVFSDIYPVPVRIEAIEWTPGEPDTGDLEPATKTVTATAKPAVADYTASATITMPPDPRVEVLRVGLKLYIYISAVGAATVLNYDVVVNGVSRLTGSFSAAVGGCHAATTLEGGAIAPDGAYSIEVYLWVDTGSVDITECRLRMGVGSNTPYTAEVVRVRHEGGFNILGSLWTSDPRVGSNDVHTLLDGLLTIMRWYDGGWYSNTQNWAGLLLSKTSFGIGSYVYDGRDISAITGSMLFLLLRWR